MNLIRTATHRLPLVVRAVVYPVLLLILVLWIGLEMARVRVKGAFGTERERRVTPQTAHTPERRVSDRSVAAAPDDQL